ncbi:MAG: hypothetical protein JSV03_01175 [Planctomycetota bacterium]|nr:MAG: hypothetical protein JSV03_01175 [Planctomycetota bacterium]
MPAINFDLVCINCGGSLRGIELNGDCPQCNSRVGNTLNLDVIDRIDLRINDDVLCVGCGYNLRTLAVSHVCPECAAPVLESLHPSELCFADKPWLRKVRMGVLLTIVVVLIVVVRILFWFFYDNYLTTGTPSQILIRFTSLIHLLNRVIFCLAVYLATLSDPCPRGMIPSSFPRWIACIGAGILLLYGAFFVILNFLVADYFAFFTSYNNFMMAVYILSTCISCLTDVCLDICLRRLAVRARRVHLRRLTSFHIFLCVCTGLVWSCRLIGWSQGGFVSSICMLIGNLSQLVEWVLYPVSIIMFFLYYRMLAAALAGKR